MPELREIGLDPAVQGVPVKKKLSVLNAGVFILHYTTILHLRAAHHLVLILLEFLDIFLSFS